MASNENEEEGRDEKGRFTEKNLWSIMKKNVGRPLKVETPELLAYKSIEYFEWSVAMDKGKFTFAGLRFYIGFSRENWREYKNRAEFVDTIDQIETILEDHWEKKLGWGGSTQGAIFWLKNKSGWRDETTQHQIIDNVKANFGTTLQPPSQPTENTSSDK